MEKFLEQHCRVGLESERHTQMKSQSKSKKDRTDSPGV